ncbi:MAG: glycosyltransferase [Epulopiscium sp.]|jgi:glycosyltransferase involved in cell wall biosynthesis|nr:glycosyltransferase [Candidatus Epulonipiscium sp.]
MDIGDKVSIVIPSLNPSHKLLALLKELRERGFLHMIIVNDGSSSQYDRYYQEAKEEYGCTILVHDKNKGKGEALKTAFSYVVSALPDCKGVVTVDSDGQHLPKDVESCAQALVQHENALILGSRNFYGKEIPWKSRFGNIITNGVFGLLCGIWLKDTQTGLRAIPYSLLEEFIAVSGEGFEYETNMLLFIKKKKIPLIEVPIQTVYEKGGHTTHFHPLRDSLKIYALFFQFVLTSAASFLLDIGIFQVFIMFLKGKYASYIMISTIVARGISSIYNFAANKKQVFHSKEKITPELVKYYIICGIQMLSSATLVQGIYGMIGGREIFIKICVDIMLFFISFQMQREWVFAEKKENT